MPETQTDDMPKAVELRTNCSVPRSAGTTTANNREWDGHGDTINCQRGTTRTDRLNSYLEEAVAELRKKYLPRVILPQIDHLHNELKEYHDVLVSSVTNVITEKISSEVLEVIHNVEDICSDRQYDWSPEDAKRLNELNEL